MVTFLRDLFTATMGVIVSFLLDLFGTSQQLLRGQFSSANGNDNDDEVEEPLSLLELLNVDIHVPAEQRQDNHQHLPAEGLPWTRIVRRLRAYPEEAAAYCHNATEASPLLRCLQCPQDNLPVSVIRALVQAYDVACFHTDRYGTTPLLAAVKRTGMHWQTTTTNTTTTTTTTMQQEQNQQETAWEIVQLLWHENPQAARQADETGKIPLHYCRVHSPMVQLLLQAYPQGVHIADEERKRLPLHYYCSLTASSSYCRRRRHFDDAAQEPHDPDNDDTSENNGDNRDGHDSSRPEADANAAVPTGNTNNNNDNNLPRLVLPDPEVARLVLQTAKTTTTSNNDLTHPVLRRDKHGLRPLDILCQEIEKLLLNDKKKSSEEQHTRAPMEPLAIDDSSCHYRHAAVETLWEILTIMVQSVVTSDDSNKTDDKDTEFQMLHSIVSLSCPASVTAEALRRFPQQAIERDAQGRTPLLIAVGILIQQYNRQHHHHHHHDSKDNNHINKTNHSNNRIEPNYQEETKVLCELLRYNPTAARMKDHEERLPIDVLAEAGVYDVQLFEALVMAEPRAVDTRDIKNKQHPFVTAALAGPRSNVVSSVYHLLRAKPHVIQSFLHAKKDK